MNKLNNRKGGVYATVMGIVIIMIGIFVYIICNLVLEGSDTTDGIIDIAVNQSWVNSTNSTHLLIRNGWMFVPICIMISGFLYMIVNSQRPEPNVYYGTAGMLKLAT